MKTTFLLLISLALSLGVSAQRKANSDEHHENHEERNEYSHQYYPRVYSIPFGYRLGYEYPYYGFGYPYFGYPYYGNPFWYGSPHNRNKAIQYKLSLQIKSIKLDYRNKIKLVRHDKSLNHLQKKQKILSLKIKRDQDIVKAEKDFAEQLPMGNQNPGMKNNQNSVDRNAVS